MTVWLNRVRQHITHWSHTGLGLVFPPRCALCDEEFSAIGGEEHLCESCRRRVEPSRARRCRRCAGVIDGHDLPPDGCPRCTALSFDAAVALGGYHAGLRDVVLRMKRPSHEGLSLAMGRLLAQESQGQLLEHGPDMVVPIPMFWLRRLGRGVNSPEIVARCLGQSLSIPVRRDILVRHRNTRPQAGLSPQHRFKNVHGAFRIRHRRTLSGARVLLVDDILTTGATCSEAAKMLKQAGAESVVVAVIARAQGEEKA